MRLSHFCKSGLSGAAFSLLLMLVLHPAVAEASTPDSLSVKYGTVMVSPYHWSEKDMVTASVSQIGGWEVEDYQGFNRMNTLNGRLTGLTNLQLTGEIGFENSNVYVRGLRSLASGAREALILVDGYVRKDAVRLNQSDIESITVLKDAAATALYGLRGANGIILITTKHGRIQPLTVSVDAGVSFQGATRLPKYLGSYDYATLYNEAAVNDGLAPVYDATALAGYQAGEDPYTYPDVNWLGEFMKPYSVNQRYNVSLRGGNDKVRYYASVGYVDNGGCWNVDESANTYDTNNGYNHFSLRGNIDVNVTDALVISLDIASMLSTWNYPGSATVDVTSNTVSNSTSRIMNSMTQVTPNCHPIFNADGSVSGTTQYQNNTYALLNQSGYSIFKTRSNYATLKVSQDLNSVLEGLSIYGSFSFDGYFEQTIHRNVGFLVYDGSLDVPVGTKSPATQNNSNSFANNYRALDGQVGLDYVKSFGEHAVKARLFGNWNEESGNGNIMPHEYLGLMGYAHYDYAKKYILDVTAAYQGSEQIGGNGFNFFPAVSAGWIISREDFMQGQDAVSFLKLRGSYGVSGNDTNINYFQKLSFFSSVGGQYLQGTNLSSMTGYRENQVAIDNIMAERSHKANLGIDTRFFSDRLSLSADGFYENNDHIIINNPTIPDILGLRGSVKENLGKVLNRGFEASLSWKDRIGDFGYSMYGNFSFARNKIIEMGETDATYRFNRKTGLPINSTFGLQSYGLFYDQADIDNHATQSYGTVKPGDIKYIDLSKDGVINEDDRTYLGFGSVPEIVFGFGLALNWKGVDLSVDFQGVSNTLKSVGGPAYWDFRPNGTGNVLAHHLNRWVYDPANGLDTRLTATYPRLSLAGNDTNNRGPASDYWLRDASCLRVKAVELGYTLPAKLIRHLGLQSMRLYLSGTNLLTFDFVGIVDPESSLSSVVFPIQKTVALGLNLKF